MVIDEVELGGAADLRDPVQETVARPEVDASHDGVGREAGEEDVGEEGCRFDPQEPGQVLALLGWALTTRRCPARARG